MTREGQGSVEVASRLSAPAQAVWERVSTFEGVNEELRHRRLRRRFG